MPKISKKTLQIREGDLNENFEFTVNYNTANGFYAEIPAKLNEQFDQLEDQELKDLGAFKQYRYKYNRNGEHKNLVSGESETAVVANMRKIAVRLLTMAMEKVPVIIVYFSNENDRHHNDTDMKLPKVGLHLSACYCFKVSTGPDSAKYYTYKEREWFGETRTDRSEVYVGRNRGDVTIIPDTPENRQFIEDLHKALALLVTKLEQFTGTSEAMLNMITNRQKLLSL